MTPQPIRDPSSQIPPRTVAKTQCAGCGKYFVGTSVFDQHRLADKLTRHGQRCMTTQEMCGSGLACELCLVRLLREGKPTSQEHEVWYCVRDRQHAEQVFASDAPECP